MENIFYNYSDELIYAISWTLLHSLWQGLLIACLLSIFAKQASSISAKVKFSAAIGSLLALLCISVLTFLMYFEMPELTSTAQSIILEDISSIDTIEYSQSNHYFINLTNLISEHSYMIVGGWFIGFLLFLMVVAHGLIQLEHIKKSIIPVSESWNDTLNELSKKIMFAKNIVLGESNKINSPLTFGFFKPVLLFPIGMLNQLTVQEVEAIMAHELAHIVRHDYLFNFVQTLVEGIYYFNPGVWIISNIIRNQREHCCDDLAIDITGNRVNYLKALVAIEETSTAQHSLAMAFSGNKKPLLQRVQRILKQPQKNTNMKEKLLMCSLVLLGLLICTLDVNSKDTTVDMEETSASTLATAEVSTTLANLEHKSVEITLADTIPHEESIIEYQDPEQKYIDIPKFEKLIEESDVKITLKDGDIEEMEINGSDLSEEEISKIQYSLSDKETEELKEKADLLIISDDDGQNTEMQKRKVRHGANLYKEKEKMKREIAKQKAEITREKENIKREIRRNSYAQNLNREEARKELQREKRNIREAIEELKAEAREGIRVTRAYTNNEYTQVQFDTLDLDDEIAAIDEMGQEISEIEMEKREIIMEFEEEMRELAQELQEEMRELEQEKIELHQELTEELIDIEQELAEEMRELQQELAEDMKELEEDMADHHTPTDDIVAIIIKELLSDGFIDNERKFTLLMKKNKMIVNGETQSIATKNKYHELLDNLTDSEWTSHSKLKIVRKGNTSITEFSLLN